MMCLSLLRKIKLLACSLIASLALCAVSLSCQNSIQVEEEKNIYPNGIISVENGEALLSVNALNQAVSLASRSILPSLGDEIYFTIVASTRQYGNDGETLDSTKASNEKYIAHTKYAGHANCSADSSMFVNAATLDTDGDGFFDASDIAKPFFALVKGIPSSQLFKLKTNTQWYFTAYGTNRSPYAIAMQYRIGTDPYKLQRDGLSPSTESDFVEYQEHWTRNDWCTLIEAIQKEAVISGDLPLYIKDNGNSDAAGFGHEQIELLSSLGGSSYDRGVSISTQTKATSYGHFLLPVMLNKQSYETDPLVVKSIKIAWTPLNDAYKSALASDGQIVWSRPAESLNTDEYKLAFYPELGEGNYELTLNFYNTSDASGEPIYEIADMLSVWGEKDSTVSADIRSEYIQFYPNQLSSSNLIRLSGSTDTSVPSSYQVKGYYLTRNTIRQYRRTRFYVSDGSGDALMAANGTGTGSIFAPFATVQEAVSRIESDANLRKNLWYIVIDGQAKDSTFISITNPVLELGESGDYTLVIQSYKPGDRAKISNGLRVRNLNESSSSLKVVLKNIDVLGDVHVATEDFILDNATVNKTGEGRTWLRYKNASGVAGAAAQTGIINISADDRDSIAKNIYVYASEANPVGFNVLRAYTINYDTPTLVPSGTDIEADADWLSRFTLNVNLVYSYDIGENDTPGDPFEGCLMIKAKPGGP